MNAKSPYACEIVFKGKEPGGFASPVRATEAGQRVNRGSCLDVQVPGR
ncbi:hypothetical protein ACFU6I_15785 [Streptomyces sp. NPDC057486]